MASNSLGLPVAGSAFISPLTDLTPYLALHEPDMQKTVEELNQAPIVDSIVLMLFTKLHDKKAELTDLKSMAEEVDFPPILINTSNDDFQVESLKLVTALVMANHDVELHNLHTSKGQTLGHVSRYAYHVLTKVRKRFG